MRISAGRRLIEKIVAFVAKITPPCQDVTRLLSQSMDRQLPLYTRMTIRLHFQICVWCKRYGEQLDTIRKASGSIPEHSERISSASLSESARQRIKEAVRHFFETTNRYE